MRKQDARILIVDDNESTRNVILEYLEFEGYHIFEARNGATAIHLLKNAQIDLVITDLFMPNGDGMKLIMSIQSKTPPPKIIVISGAISESEYFERAKEFGADATFSKPVALERLTAEVAKLLSIE